MTYQSGRITEERLKKMINKYFCYILRCADNSLYTGYTVDLERRLSEHNSGDKGAKYTKNRRPCNLVYYEEFDNKSDAMRRETAIKRLSKKAKEELILGFSKL